MNDTLLADYVRQCANLMGLSDWTVFVSSDPKAEPKNGVDEPSQQRCATFVGTFGRKSASIWFKRKYLRKASPEDIRQTTAHELVHAIWHPTREVAIMLAGMAGRPNSETLLGCYDVTSEYAIDQLGDLVAQLLPMPPKGKDGHD